MDLLVTARRFLILKATFESVESDVRTDTEVEEVLERIGE